VKSLLICCAACEYLAAVGTSQLGLPSSVSDLDEDQKALLLESYSADPVWSKKGEASVDAPAPIRAGRLVVELYEADVGVYCEVLPAYSNC
jgi:hypothetical protein